jgi:hypothetical protein
MKYFFQATISATVLAFCLTMIALYPNSDSKIITFWGTAQTIVAYWLPSPVINKKEEDK